MQYDNPRQAKRPQLIFHQSKLRDHTDHTNCPWKNISDIISGISSLIMSYVMLFLWEYSHTVLTPSGQQSSSYCCIWKCPLPADTVSLIWEIFSQMWLKINCFWGRTWEWDVERSSNGQCASFQHKPDVGGVDVYEHNNSMMQNNLQPTHMDQHQVKQLIHSKSFVNDELRALRWTQKLNRLWLTYCVCCYTDPATYINLHVVLRTCIEDLGFISPSSFGSHPLLLQKTCFLLHIALYAHDNITHSWYGLCFPKACEE